MGLTLISLREHVPHGAKPRYNATAQCWETYETILQNIEYAGPGIVLGTDTDLGIGFVPPDWGPYAFTYEINIDAAIGNNQDIVVLIELYNETQSSIVWEQKVTQTRASAGTFAINGAFLAVIDETNLGNIFRFYGSNLGQGTLTMLSGSYSDQMGPL